MSLFTIFPRETGVQGRSAFTTTTITPAQPEMAPEDVDIEAVTVSDMLYMYEAYGTNMDYR